MHVRARRGVTAGLGLLVTAALLSSCGGGSDPVQVGAGADPASPAQADPTPTTEGPTEVAAEPPPADGPSSVEGLTVDELRTAVEAPASAAATSARRRGPVAEQVTVGSRTLWRITIPGSFQVLSSQIVVAVGGSDVGVAVVAPDLRSLVAVTTDDSLVRSGSEVTYRWGAQAPSVAGALEVVR